MYPEARSVGAWLKGGWHVALAYVIGFAVMLAVLGWHPDAAHRPPAPVDNATHATNVPTPSATKP
jgi:hypothetical protein